MTIEEVDYSGAYSAVEMNDSKVRHTRMGHIGHNQFQHSDKIVDGINAKMNRDITGVCETCASGKYQLMRIQACRVVSATHPLRPYSRISRPETLLFLSSSSSVVLTRLSGPRE
jgi:hypothetical protein